MEEHLPPHFRSLEDALSSLFGNSAKMEHRQRISGGDINEAYCLALTDGTCIFMKANTIENASFFSAEAAGLTAIAKTGAINVPRVLCSGTDKEQGSFLLLEFIAGKAPVSDYWETFALQLSQMHKADTSVFVKEGNYGFVSDNYIGSGIQKNTAYEKWTSFFRDCRLEPQFRRAADYFDSAERKKITWLLDHLNDILVEPEHPSLLHGDLWQGNVITGPDGRAWLIDPAVYVGNAEADIAMTELFGGFSQRFYDAYKETGLLLPGYSSRKNLYNLYHLLNHLNIFGRAYLSSVRNVVREYVP